MNNGNGDVQGEAVAQKAGKLINTRSKFDKLGYPFFTTNRFGEITPFFVMENVDGDKNNKLLSGSKVDSYTLKVPLMQDVKMKKEIFYVPRQALLPLNWEKFYTNPNIGDDVPDDCGTTVKGFWYKVANYIYTSYAGFATDFAQLDDTSESYVSDLNTLADKYFKWIFLGECFFSDGSLVAQLGENGSKFLKFFEASNLLFSDVDFKSYDSYFDAVFGYLAANSITFLCTDTDTVTWLVSPDGNADNPAQYYQISYREFLDKMRDDVSWATISIPDGFESVWENFLGIFLNPSIQINAVESDHLDLARLWSYQLVCAHFYTNDHVDYVYSADLFRQYILDLVTRTYNSYAEGYPVINAQFTVNGIKYNYDAFSARYFDAVLSFLSSANPSSVIVRPESLSDAFAYFQAILSYRHSLRFVDYFVASRTRPLAVGDTDVTVNSNKASVIDITRNIMMQKFLNAVNRIGRKESDYSVLMGGDGRKPDFHNPLWIGRTSDVIYGDRSEYTGTVEDAQQNNVTSLLKNAGGKYLFSWEIDRPGICIGVCYYDIERVYTQLIERQAFHVNRFDMFDPYQQFIGDQAIYPSEIKTGGTGQNVTPFAYENRHLEYKLRVPRAAGGFVSDSGLPSWIFAAERGFRKYEDHQSPSFIRSFNSEFDQFYKDLTGWSLGTYFHFIVRHINVCSVSRPMAVAPDILQ